MAGWKSPVGYFPEFVQDIDVDAKTVLDSAA